MRRGARLFGRRDGGRRGSRRRSSPSGIDRRLAEAGKRKRKVYLSRSQGVSGLYFQNKTTFNWRGTLGVSKSSSINLSICLITYTYNLLKNIGTYHNLDVQIEKQYTHFVTLCSIKTCILILSLPSNRKKMHL